jgi:geranylgeranyl diphosphate synthase type II
MDVSSLNQSSLSSLEDILKLYLSYAKEHPFQQKPSELYEPINYILNIGGKRLRPALVLMSYNLFKDDIEKALAPAHAIEIFHNFTLVHDDIMDEAPLRRGQPTIHTKYDTNIAILSGDVMLIYAYEYLLQVPANVVAKVIKAFNRFAIAVCEGQQFDVNFETRNDVEIPEYIRMIELKTAALIAGALEIGAYVGGASDENAFHIAEFGRNVGIAFQLQDDILDTFGDPEKFGKKVGGDIAQNKKTYLVLKSLELADETTRAELEGLLSTKPADEKSKIKAVTDIFNKLHLRKHATAEKSKYLDKAYHHLNSIEVDDDKKKVLKSFAKMLVDREV